MEAGEPRGAGGGRERGRPRGGWSPLGCEERLGMGASGVLGLVRPVEDLAPLPLSPRASHSWGGPCSPERGSWTRRRPRGGGSEERGGPRTRRRGVAWGAGAGGGWGEAREAQGPASARWWNVPVPQAPPLRASLCPFFKADMGPPWPVCPQHPVSALTWSHLHVLIYPLPSRSGHSVAETPKTLGLTFLLICFYTAYDSPA